MATVIPNEKLIRHTVDKYNFKVLSVGRAQEIKSKEASPSAFVGDIQAPTRAELEDTPKEEQKPSENTPTKDSHTESLLKQVDEVTSNFIKLQMKLESKEEEFKKELEQVKEAAFLEGQTKGEEDAAKNIEQKYADGLGQFAASIQSLEEIAKDFQSSLEGIKSELISAAFDISKEVVKVELSENSNMVAKMLASELIEDLQDASKIRLKVNPKNHTALSQELAELKNIEIVPDKAISEGGIIALSDVGNIDAQIDKRFEKVKKAALGD